MRKLFVVFGFLIIGCGIMEVEMRDSFLSLDDKISIVITQDSIMRIYTGIKDKGNVRFRINEGDIDTLKSMNVRVITDKKEYKLEGVMLIKDEENKCYRLSSEDFITEQQKRNSTG